MKLLIIILAACIISTNAYGKALETGSKSLHQEIQTMDNKLFNIAFNQCNIEFWKDIVNEDIEFYDDRTGLNTSFEKEVRSFEDKCSKPFEITRQLVSNEIHPLGKYGALQTGKHNFYVDGGELIEKSQFITVWERTADSWTVKRVVSYDHQAVEP